MTNLHQQFRDCEAKYRDLAARRDSGQMRPEELTAASSSLRVQDQAGFVWQIDPGFGDWIKWDGAALDSGRSLWR